MKSLLTHIDTKDIDVVIELAYATPNNFTGNTLYKNSKCFLLPAAVTCLQRAVNLLKPLGLYIKIWDGFRPLTIQQALFDHTPNPEYVSHPVWGQRPHPRGAALDVTLVDEQGNELNMGTQFDDFRTLAQHGNVDISTEAQRNRLVLAGAMLMAGFEKNDSEWWHYQLPDLTDYPIIEEDAAINEMLYIEETASKV